MTSQELAELAFYSLDIVYQLKQAIRSMQAIPTPKNINQ
jgi:hypothetical protein